jgi:hypothetical protein
MTESMDEITAPLGLQAAGGTNALAASHSKKVGSVARAIIVSYTVEHDVGAVNVVVSGPLLRRL